MMTSDDAERAALYEAVTQKLYYRNTWNELWAKQSLISLLLLIENAKLIVD